MSRSQPFPITPGPRVAAMLCACLASLPLLLAGCAGGGSGYSAGGVFPTQYRSVSIPIFHNDTFDRKTAPELADALVKAVESRTPYKVTREGAADTVLRGTIRKVDLRQMSQSRATGLSEEMAFTVTLDFEWVDARTGKAIVARNAFQGSAVFVASRPNMETIDLGRFEAVDRLAQDIVASMQGDW